jgi:hypothetical protein
MKKVAMLILFSTLLFADSNVSGKVFFNHTIDLGEDGSSAFNMKRAYLTFANNVSDDLSYKLTYDIGSNEGGSAYTAFLKVAMVKWKSRLGDISIGMQGMNMFKTMENTWGHRFIEKMPMDTYKFSPSADLGIGVTRSFGPVSTSALIMNGGGFKKPETDSHKKLSFHAVYGESKLNKKDGFNAGASFSIEPYDVNTATVENKNVMGVFGGYAGTGFRGGLEFDTKTQGDVRAQIISAYGTYKLLNKLSILGRFDQYNNDDGIENEKEQNIIAGIKYNADKGLTIAPTFRMTTLEGEDSENSIVVNFQFKF